MKSRLLKLIAKRLVVAVLTLLIVAVTIFIATQLLPGDVAEIVLGQAATPAAVGTK